MQPVQFARWEASLARSYQDSRRAKQRTGDGRRATGGWEVVLSLRCPACAALFRVASLPKSCSRADYSPTFNLQHVVSCPSCPSCRRLVSSCLSALLCSAAPRRTHRMRSIVSFVPNTAGLLACNAMPRHALSSQAGHPAIRRRRMQA